MSELWILLILCTLGTYAWRGLGVLLAGRLEPDSDLFRWVSCVAYAMIAGLVMRLIVMPGGPLAGRLLAPLAVLLRLSLAQVRRGAQRSAAKVEHRVA